jgi:hypothetical protein
VFQQSFIISISKNYFKNTIEEMNPFIQTRITHGNINYESIIYIYRIVYWKPAKKSVTITLSLSSTSGLISPSTRMDLRTS